MAVLNLMFNKKFWKDPSKFCKFVDPNTTKYKVNTALVIKNMQSECYRDNQVYYNQMQPLFEQNVDFKYADYIIYANPTARMHDFTPVIMDDIDHIVQVMKPEAEIIVVGKAANVESAVRAKYPDVKFSFMFDHFVKYLGQKFEINMSDQYITYDYGEPREFVSPQLNIWPVNGCLGKCGFCRRCYMHIPFESIPIDKIKKVLDENKSLMYNVSLRAENLTQYGLDIYKQQKLDELIDLLNSYDEIHNIEIPIGLHIGEINDKILDALCNCKKMKSIVMSVETGTDRLLKLINKNNTCQNIIKVCGRLRSELPQLSLSCLTMIGLPTETEQDVIDLAKLVERCGFDTVTCNFYTSDPKQPLYKLPQLSEEERIAHMDLFISTLQNIHSSKRIMELTYELPMYEPESEHLEQVLTNTGYLMGKGSTLELSEEEIENIINSNMADYEENSCTRVFLDRLLEQAKKELPDFYSNETENTESPNDTITAKTNQQD